MEEFKNARIVCTTSYAAAYTCPAGKTALVTLLQAANTGTVARTVSAQWTDDSDSDAATRLANNIPLPVGASCGLVDGKLALEAGDQIQVKASANTDVEVTISVVEVS